MKYVSTYATTMSTLQGTGELLVKPPLHRAATFVPPLSDPKYDQDAQRSPKPKESCFCVTASATFVLPLKDILFKDRMWRHNKSHKGGRTKAESPWSPNGGRVVVTVIVQSTLLEAQRRHRGGRNVVHIEGLSFAVERVTWQNRYVTAKSHSSPYVMSSPANWVDATQQRSGDHRPTIMHPFCNHGDAAAFPLHHLSDR